MATSQVKLQHPKVVSPAQWLAAHQKHLAKEKEFTRLRDELSRQRRELPWEKVEKEYTFEGPQGKQTLADLFGKRSQLIVYHFMLAPGWKEGCRGCSFLGDHFEGPSLHVPQRDVALMAVSRAPLAEIEAYKKRMGWRFPWVSSFGSDFNYDYHVSFTKDEIASGEKLYNHGTAKAPSDEMPGLSAFYKDEAGEIFHTYSAYARGLDILVGTYNFLDMAPKGRDEDGLTSPMSWVKRHDEYDA